MIQANPSQMLLSIVSFGHMLNNFALRYNVYSLMCDLAK